MLTLYPYSYPAERRKEPRHAGQGQIAFQLGSQLAYRGVYPHLTAIELTMTDERKQVYLRGERVRLGSSKRTRTAPETQSEKSLALKHSVY